MSNEHQSSTDIKNLRRAWRRGRASSPQPRLSSNVAADGSLIVGDNPFVSPSSAIATDSTEMQFRLAVPGSWPKSTTGESEMKEASLPPRVHPSGFFSNSSNIAIHNSILNAFSGNLNIDNGKGLFAPPSSSLFTGQRAVLDKLKDHFAPRGNNHMENQRRFLLYGMGGIGKTQIGLKFMEEMSSQFSLAFWIDASSTDTITERHISSADVQSMLRSIPHQKEEWLIVFDGADSLAVASSIPPGRRGNILITSRNPSLERLTSFHKHEVVEMEEGDAVSLLLKGCRLKDRDSASKIVRVLGCLPLAIDHAGASIRDGLCGIRNYVEQFHHHHHRLQLMNDSVFNVYGTWELSFKNIEKAAIESGAQAAQNAITILQIFAFCHYDNIPEGLFQYAAEESKKGTTILDFDLVTALLQLNEDGKWNNFCFREGLRVLVSSSLIRKSSSSTFFSVHPLVHFWSRDRMEASQKSKICHVVSMLLGCAVLEQFGTHDYAFRQSLLPHIKANKKFSDEIGLEKMFNDHQYTKFALVFKESGDWNEAEELQLEVTKKRKAMHGAEDLSTLNSLGNLASIYCGQGRWKDAEELESQIVIIMEKVLGQDHPDTLRSKGNLASTYRNQGHVLKAEELQVLVLKQTKDRLGDEHPDTLTIMGNLAVTHRNLGHWNEAEKLEFHVMNALKKHFGAEHPDTLTSMGNLAIIYRNKGQWDEAEKLEHQVVNGRKKMFGEEHPATLTSIGCLALTYRKKGHWEQARDLQIQVMETTKRLLGEEHPNTLSSMGNLAATYKKQGQLEEAEVLEVQVSEMSKKVLGAEHPDTLTSMGSLASIYRKQKRFPEAVELQNKVIKIKTKVLGEDHPDTLISIGGLASTYCNQGHFKDAKELGVYVMEKSKIKLGEEHPDTLTSMGNLASTYCKLKRWNKAEKLELQVMNIRQRLYGENHPDTLISMGNLVSIYKRLENWTEAEKLEVQTVQLLEAKKGPFGAKQ